MSWIGVRTARITLQNGTSIAINKISSTIRNCKHENRLRPAYTLDLVARRHEERYKYTLPELHVNPQAFRCLRSNNSFILLIRFQWINLDIFCRRRRYQMFNNRFRKSTVTVRSESIFIYDSPKPRDPTTFPKQFSKLEKLFLFSTSLII